MNLIPRKFFSFRTLVTLAALCGIAVALVVTLTPKPKVDERPPIHASDVFRNTVASAKSIVVYEGLPHQMWDRELLETELKRPDTTEIYHFPFYTPGVEAANADELRKLLSSPDSLKVYGGPYLCGGYHPDYCVSWKAEGVDYYALICFGCHEIVFFDGKVSLQYDLAKPAYEELQRVLGAYEKKRPKSER